MNKYEIRTNIKKEAILHASLDLFKKQGFINTNIKNIAESAKVSQVSIYNYFGSKNQLLKEVISYLTDGMVSTAEEILAEALPFPDKVKKALSLCSEEFENVIEEFFSVAALDDPQMAQAIISTLKEKNNYLYEKYIESGKAEGYVDKTIPTSTIVDFLNSMGNNPNYRQNNAQYRDDIVKLFINGILIK
ncbi:MAG: TetR family transcriptional regulator [Eubacterium sp.]|nr:TetR family transcriptional regulator [Eubacterium sp.]